MEPLAGVKETIGLMALQMIYKRPLPSRIALLLRLLSRGDCAFGNQCVDALKPVLSPSASLSVTSSSSRVPPSQSNASPSKLLLFFKRSPAMSLYKNSDVEENTCKPCTFWRQRQKNQVRYGSAWSTQVVLGQLGYLDFISIFKQMNQQIFFLCLEILF